MQWLSSPIRTAGQTGYSTAHCDAHRPPLARLAVVSSSRFAARGSRFAVRASQFPVLSERECGRVEGEGERNEACDSIGGQAVSGPGGRDADVGTDSRRDRTTTAGTGTSGDRSGADSGARRTSCEPQCGGDCGGSQEHAGAARDHRAPSWSERQRGGTEPRQLRRGARQSIPEPSRSTDARERAEGHER